MPEPYVLFEVAGATYAVRSADVQQVEMVDQITRVPNAPAFVEGVVSVRGQVFPVISLRKRFHMPAQPVDLRSRILIIRLEGRHVGMLVDAAREFVRLDEDQISPPPENLNGPGVAYLRGIAHLGSRLILIVDLPQLLNMEERVRFAESEVTREQKGTPHV